MTCDFRIPAVTARVRRGPPVPDAVRIQHGSVPRQLSVVEAAPGRWRLGLLPGDVGVAEPEAELLVQVVGRYPRGAGGQVDAASALLLRQVNRGHGQGCAHAVAAGVLVDNDMFDRIASSGRAVRQPGMLGWRSSRVPASGSGG